jgi:hypothetical protein
MMILIFVPFVLAQSNNVNKPLGVEPFDYELGDFFESRRNGGDGFVNNAQWSADRSKCTVAPINWNISLNHLPTLISSSTPKMVGIDAAEQGSQLRCVISRELSPSALNFTYLGTSWFSVLIGLNRSNPLWSESAQRNRPTTPAFLVAVGESEAFVRNNGDVSYSGIYSNGVHVGPTDASLTGNQPRQNTEFILQHVGLNGVSFDTSRISTLLPTEWPSSLLLVMSITWDRFQIGTFPQNIVRAALFDASLPPPTSMPSNASQVTMVGSNPNVRRFVTLWMQNSFASWLRVGTSFESVVGNIALTVPLNQSTATTTTTSDQKTTTTTRTTTTTTRRGATTTTEPRLTLASVDPTQTDSSTSGVDVDVSETTKQQQCDAATSCDACVVGGRCHWCVAERRCLVVADETKDNCTIVALSAKSCEEQQNATAPSARGEPQAVSDAVPAIVGGVIGGCLFLLLLLVLIVFLVRRSRQSPSGDGGGGGKKAQQASGGGSVDSEYEFADLAAMREEADHYRAMEMNE